MKESEELKSARTKYLSKLTKYGALPMPATAHYTAGYKDGSNILWAVAQTCAEAERRFEESQADNAALKEQIAQLELIRDEHDERGIDIDILVQNLNSAEAKLTTLQSKSAALVDALEGSIRTFERINSKNDQAAEMSLASMKDAGVDTNFKWPGGYFEDIAEMAQGRRGICIKALAAFKGEK